jgi:hypothetical protein
VLLDGIGRREKVERVGCRGHWQAEQGRSIAMHFVGLRATPPT